MQTAQRRSWTLVWLVWACGVAAAMHVGKAPPALPYLVDSIGLSLTQAGWITSTISFIGITLGMLAGRGSDRFGARNFICLGLVIVAAGSVLGSFATSFTTLIGTRIIESMGLLCVMVSGPSLMQRYAPADQTGMAMGIWGAFMPFGTALVLLLAPVAIFLMDWRLIWWFAAAVTLGTAAIAFLYLPTAPTNSSSSNLWHDLKLVMQRHSILLAGVCFCIYAACYLAVLSFFPIWLPETRNVPVALASALGALYAASNISGNLTAGHLIRKGVAPHLLIRIGAASMAAMAVLMFLSGAPLWVVLICSMLFSGAGGLIPASCFSLVGKRSPSPALIGVCTGVVWQFVFLGQWLGPPALAATVDHFGSWNAAPIMLVSICTLSLVASFAIGRALKAGR